MLVLSRKNAESVVVGRPGRFESIVRVTVLEISGGGVRLGFEAGEAVPIYREEVWERIQSAGQRDPPTVGKKAKVLSGGEDRKARPSRAQGVGSMIDVLVRGSIAVVTEVPRC